MFGQRFALLLNLSLTILTVPRGFLEKLPLVTNYASEPWSDVICRTQPAVQKVGSYYWFIQCDEFFIVDETGKVIAHKFIPRDYWETIFQSYGIWSAWHQIIPWGDGAIGLAGAPEFSPTLGVYRFSSTGEIQDSWLFTFDLYKTPLTDSASYLIYNDKLYLFAGNIIVLDQSLHPLHYFSYRNSPYKPVWKGVVGPDGYLWCTESGDFEYENNARVTKIKENGEVVREMKVYPNLTDPVPELKGWSVSIMTPLPFGKMILGLYYYDYYQKTWYRYSVLCCLSFQGEVLWARAYRNFFPMSGLALSDGRVVVIGNAWLQDDSTGWDSGLYLVFSPEGELTQSLLLSQPVRWTLSLDYFLAPISEGGNVLVDQWIDWDTGESKLLAHFFFPHRFFYGCSGFRWIDLSSREVSVTLTVEEEDVWAVPEEWELPMVEEYPLELQDGPLGPINRCDFFTPELPIKEKRNPLP